MFHRQLSGRKEALAEADFKISGEEIKMNDRSIDDDDDDFLKSLFFYAVVVRSDFPTIQELKQYLVDKGIDVKFQKLSTNYLKITEGDK